MPNNCRFIKYLTFLNQTYYNIMSFGLQLVRDYYHHCGKIWKANLQKMSSFTRQTVIPQPTALNCFKSGNVMACYNIVGAKRGILLAENSTKHSNI